MPPISNCQRIHADRPPGPCVNCKQNDISNRYIHLAQCFFFYSFVKILYGFNDFDCICRKCESKFRRMTQMSSNCDESVCKKVTLPCESSQSDLSNR